MMTMKFKAVKVAQVLCGIYILGVTFAPLGSLGPFGGAVSPSGFIIDPASPENTQHGVVNWNGDLRAVIAATTTQMILLGISRFSGFFMYPALILCFLTKLRATCAFLSSTMFSMFMYQDMHRLHTYCGWVILLDSLVHTTCHLLRWALQGNLYLLFSHKSGITGFTVIVSTFLICIPMIVWKERIKYELRKLCHYLFIVFGVAMCFHAPKSAVPNGGFSAYIFPIIMIWYALDSLFCSIFMTELIETTKYTTLPNSGVQMTMAVSKRFQSFGSKGGYAYVCFPWISRNEWHAFSLYENPENPEERQIFMQCNGDWTKKVHELLQRDTVRPVWIQGPYPSPYKNAIKYDNQILVAGGIGITPALSVIQAHKEYRCVNLIWAVRDPAMLQFYLDHSYLDHRGWNLIFYTGKQTLPTKLMETVSGTNICIIQARPDLSKVIPNIIYGFESGVGRSDMYVPDRRSNAIEQLQEHLNNIDVHPLLNSDDKLAEIEHYAHELGYSLNDLSAEISQSSKLQRTKRMNSSDPSLCDTVDTLTSDGSEMDPEIGFQSRTDYFLSQIRAFERNSPKVLAADTMFEPWEQHEEALDYVLNLDKQEIKSTWGILYCGGKGPLLKSLEKISDKVDVKLYKESFNW